MTGALARVVSETMPAPMMFASQPAPPSGRPQIGGWRHYTYCQRLHFTVGLR